jgi:hypothetical protein
MATDTRQPKQQLTLADLCEAIADEKVAPRREGSDYLLTALDVRRMGRSDTLDIPTELLAGFGEVVRGDAPLH